MIGVGIDPGLASTGWAVVERYGLGEFSVMAAGTITTQPKTDLTERLRKIRYDVRERIAENTLGLRVDTIGIERIQVGQRVNPSALVAAGYVVGMVFGMYPTARVMKASEWRRSIGAGNGSPDKVRHAVRRMIGDLHGSDHVFDATGIALYAMTIEAAR